ncbi:hypothetical protein BDEG_25551 [Batrachochytrium dendrobatidis JEL423]|uniref:Uncharacterized protein n=1 Tax=Batrachochytrium dendrobatidis (strain JEL423) TaxID=403673 RepID=A0A177WPK5_BATDL|nr:hypothetical protein BDEG_25551 [Batrachochytrium dendrobatidis JEL423]
MIVDFCIQKQSKTTLKQTLWTDSTKEMAVSSVINSDTLVSPVPYTMSHIWTHMDTNATIKNQLSFTSPNCQPTIVLMDQRTNAKTPAHQTLDYYLQSMQSLVSMTDNNETKRFPTSDYTHSFWNVTLHRYRKYQPESEPNESSECRKLAFI